MQILLAILAMSLEFLLAPRVQVGNVPLASDMAGLADAANVKDRSGLGDDHYRLSDYCLNWARQIRNADEFGFMPSMGEYWEIYAYLNPKQDIPTIPVAGPGEPEGSNATCPPVVFQFGNEEANISQEEDRLGVVDLWEGARPPQTLEEWWDVAKRQRGVYDPSNGAQNVPAIQAARSAQNIWWPAGIPHGKTTGGFFPTPVKLLDDCEEGTGNLPIPSYQYKFTAIRDNIIIPSTRGSVSTNADGRAVITYAGSCPFNTLDFGGNDVQGISHLSEYSLVFFVDGFDVLPTSDWVEGPYNQDGILTRYNAEHFDRAVWAMVNDFRGTPSQRDPDDFNIEDIAFDFEAFSGKQYHLSPNIGVETGIGLQPAYPQAKAAAASVLQAGTILAFQGQPSHSYSPGFVFTGCFAKATNLSQPVTLKVWNGKKSVIATLTLTPEQPQALIYVADAVIPNPLRVECVGAVHFSSPGEIVFEANEILNYKPDHWDAYMLLRLAATFGGDENDLAPFLDGAGIDCTGANGIYKNYQTFGCVVNTFTSGIRSVETALNESPFYDANRRVLNSLFRHVRRQEMLSYEKDSLGRPVLRIKRYAFGLKNIKADIFDGIAPSYEGVSKVVEGTEYVVRSHTGGTVDYSGHRYSLNQRFVANATAEFITNGDALVLEYEGIKPVAQKKGWTNEWLMSEEFHFEHPSSTSLWTTDKHADWYVRGNRCLTYARSLDGNLTRMVDLPVYPGIDPTFQQLHLSPEAPSGWNYTLRANASASPDFCASCQIYKAPYELASATVEFDANGNDVVRLVFKEPFQHDPGAPAVFGRDPTTWDIAALRAEPYRTTDNGLREYFYYLATGTHGSWKVGDAAYNSDIQSLPDNPFGCILPRLFFTSLAKRPHLDGNNVLDANDTRITIDELFKLEIKLKCWCEGAIDAFATVENICGGGSFPYDFTFENLKLKAFGGGKIGRGHGPMVNTVLDANTFNQIAACLDELFMFRVEGIMELQGKQINYTTTVDVSATWPSPPSLTYTCPPNAGLVAYYDGTPPTPSPDFEGGWATTGLLSATLGGSLTPCGPGGASLGMQSSKSDVQYRYVAVTGFENAIPPNVQSLVDNRNAGVVGSVETLESIPQRHTASDLSQAGCSTSHFTPAFTDGTTSWYFDSATPSSVGCMMIANGLLTAGTAAPGGSFPICIYPDSGNINGYSISTIGSSKSVTFSLLGATGTAILIVPMVRQEAAT
jgi:hypothetical protein